MENIDSFSIYSFTKEELQMMHIHLKRNKFTESIIIKLENLITNYCLHKDIYVDSGCVARCEDCNIIIEDRI